MDRVPAETLDAVRDKILAQSAAQLALALAEAARALGRPSVARELRALAHHARTPTPGPARAGDPTALSMLAQAPPAELDVRRWAAEARRTGDDRLAMAALHQLAWPWRHTLAGVGDAALGTRFSQAALAPRGGRR